MDMQKKKRRSVRLLPLLRHYYQWFFVHFVLSLAVVSVLFCLSFHMVQMAESAALPRVLRCGIYTAGEKPPLSFSEQMLRAALGPADRPVSVPPDTGKEQISTETDSPAALLPHQPPADPVNHPHPSKISKEELYRIQDPSAAKDHTILIQPADLSSAQLYTPKNQGILFSNQTAFSPEPGRLLAAPYPIPFQIPEDGEPLVLILHTHGTEAFAPDGASAVPDTYSARSQDLTQNVVAVGCVMTAVLEKAGLPVLHCETMFDKESYPDAYPKAASYIRETVAAHPSIRYVFDIHRDALISGETTILRPVTLIGEEISAQVMCVVGTNEAGADHPHWETNLTVAAQLQKRLNDAYPGFARPINLRSAGFNAQYAPGSILLEIGSSGNSTEEVKTAAYYLGLQIAALIREEP